MFTLVNKTIYQNPGGVFTNTVTLTNPASTGNLLLVVETRPTGGSSTVTVSNSQPLDGFEPLIFADGGGTSPPWPADAPALHSYAIVVSSTIVSVSFSPSTGSNAASIAVYEFSCDNATDTLNDNALGLNVVTPNTTVSSINSGGVAQGNAATNSNLYFGLMFTGSTGELSSFPSNFNVDVFDYGSSGPTGPNSMAVGYYIGNGTNSYSASVSPNDYAAVLLGGLFDEGSSMSTVALLADGFDEYDVLGDVWNVVNNPSGVVMGDVGRFTAPVGCVTSSSVSVTNASASKLFVGAATPSSIVMGIAINMEELPPVGAPTNLFGVQNGGGVVLTTVWLNSSGQLFMTYDENPAHIIGGSGALTPVDTVFIHTWYYIELAALLSTTVGTAALYVNQEELLSFTGTQTSLSPACAYSYISSNGPQTIYDDLYAIGGTVTPLGNTRILTKVPNGTGDLQNWAANGAAVEWECVDDVPPDDDITYASASTNILQADSVPVVGLGTISQSGPTFLLTRSRARYDDGGPHTLNNGVRNGGTNALGSAVSLGAGYAPVENAVLLDPATGVAWTNTGADTAQILKSRVS
jgi:hypothetical protein